MTPLLQAVRRAPPRRLPMAIVAYAAGAFVLLSALSLPASPAFACGACECEPALRVVPQFNRDAPLNYQPLLLSEAGSGATPRVVDAAGQSVTISLLAVEGREGAFWIRPDAPWPAETEFSILVGEEVVGSFETSTQTDNLAPEVEGVSLAQGEGSSAHCTAVEGVRLQVRRAVDVQGTSSDLVAILRSASGVAITLLTGSDSTQSRVIGDGTQDANCLGAAQLPLPSAGGDEAELSVYDSAGNQTSIAALVMPPSGTIGGGTCGPFENDGESSARNDADGGSSLPSDTDADGGSSLPRDADGGGSAPNTDDRTDGGPAAASQSGGCTTASGQASGSLASLLLGLFAYLRRRRAH